MLLLVPEEVTVLLVPEVVTVSLLAPEEVVVSLLAPEVAVVSPLVPEQTREVRFTGTSKPFFLGLPDPPGLKWGGRGVD